MLQVYVGPEAPTRIEQEGERHMMGTYRMRLATAYVPIQSTDGYLRRRVCPATIFPELYSYAATEKAR